MADEAYLSMEEVAKRLGVVEKTIDKYVRQGRLKAVKNPISGSVVGIRESDLQEFLTGKPAEPKVEMKQSGEIPEVAEARKQTTLEKELTEQAKLQNEQNKAKVEIELRQKGYDSIEAGLVDVEAKIKDALDQLEMANRERASVRAELEAIAKEKQKAINALAVAKERERLVNEKWAEVMIHEENQKAFVNKYDGLKKELLELVEYHKSHISPCVKALEAVSKVIYIWADLLNRSTRYDLTELYNYIGKVMEIIDQYVDHVPTSVPMVEVKEVENGIKDTEKEE